MRPGPSLAALLVAALPAWAAGSAVADAWRHGGTAVYADATPPTAWTTPTWRAPLGASGHASPARVGDVVCTTAEPTTVLCADAATGRLRWRATTDRLDTVPEAERAAVRARLTEEPALKLRLDAARRTLSDVRKEARSAAPPADLSARLEAAAAELDTVKGKLDEIAGWTTPPILDPVGWASPTPATDGANLYVLTGNGVVSSFTPAGSRRWAVWLGTPPRPMVGYEFGTASSPAMLGDKLIVAYRNLMALDPRTGAVVWKDAREWRQYGTPAVATVGGVGVIATPDGRLVRASDGRELASKLGDIWYVGPVIRDNVLYVIGSRGEHGTPGSVSAAAWSLAADGQGGVRATALWSRKLATSERLYVPPVVHGGFAYVLTIDSVLHVLDARTGADVGSLSLDDGSPLGTFPSPTIAGDKLFLGWESGRWAAVSLGPRPVRVAGGKLPENGRATPVFEGGSVYVRTSAALYRYDR